MNTVKLLKSQRWIWDELREACGSLESNYARKREAGHWELVVVAFVASRQVHIQGFFDETTDELWRECGFESKPPYMRVWRRLRELETICEEFLKAAGVIIRHCREHDSRVMSHVHFDFTEDETHASLIHDCQPDEPCAYRAKATRSGRRRAAPGHAMRPARATTGIARRDREDRNTEDPETSAKRDKESLPEKVVITQRGSKLIKRIRQKGCWYRTRDLKAGIRAYEGERGARRFWHGYYAGKAVDHFTGGAIPCVENASKQEYHLFPALYDRVCEMSGSTPETVVGDKGFSIRSCFEYATTNGSAPVFPWRTSGGDRKRHDRDTHDRHGTVRCKYCGGQTEQVRFSTANGKPRLWVRCITGVTADCGKEQTISCSTDWKTLIPLSRLQPIYHELKQSHGTYEGVHDYWRDRYKVAADEGGIRPRVVSRDWHRLRSYAACLIDWLRIAAKNDWLGSARSARRKGERRFKDAGARIARELTEIRVRIGLAQPYGPKAVALGLGEALPPSERQRGAPPGKL